MIVERIGLPAMHEMLAEECTELAHEALKMARVTRGENPTPKTEGEVWEHLIEEVTDVALCASELGLAYDPDLWEEKVERFQRRWTKACEKDDLSDILKKIKESGE
ncbi:MAG: hypothetical protein IJL91_06890 [Bacteroidales bacterium]|nr:hypothetical protein [Bacteroidales bacterium]